MSMGISVRSLNAWFGKTQALHDITIEIPASQVTAIIGPSGCGKSTFVRCLNRMHETVPGTRVEGLVRIGDMDLTGLARSLGANGIRVETEAELEPAFTEALNVKGPVLVEVLTDPEVLSPGTRLSELLQR